MPTNISFAERASEIRATSECAMIVRILNDATVEPSTKRFVKSRATRIERWMQLEAAARTQINGLQALAKAPRAARTPKAPKVPGTGVPITHINEEAAQQTA